MRGSSGWRGRAMIVQSGQPNLAGTGFERSCGCWVTLTETWSYDAERPAARRKRFPRHCMITAPRSIEETFIPSTISPSLTISSFPPGPRIDATR